MTVSFRSQKLPCIRWSTLKLYGKDEAFVVKDESIRQSYKIPNKNNFQTLWTVVRDTLSRSKIKIQGKAKNFLGAWVGRENLPGNLIVVAISVFMLFIAEWDSTFSSCLHGKSDCHTSTTTQLFSITKNEALGHAAGWNHLKEEPEQNNYNNYKNFCFNLNFQMRLLNKRGKCWKSVKGQVQVLLF